jgi:outer membrane PBP1 activator LpoA protein
MQRTVQFLIYIIIASYLVACSGVRMLTPEEIYSPEFLKRIEGIHTIYKDGDKRGALDKLNAMNDLELSEAELAKKYNFIGIIFFSEQDYDTAIEKFELARAKARLDMNLQAQVNLNIASSYYKKSLLEKSFAYTDLVNVKALKEDETEKYFKLRLILAQQLEKPKDVVRSVIPLIGKTSVFKEIDEHQYKEVLLDNFRKLSASERVYLLEEFASKDNISSAYLAKEEALNRYYMADRPGAEDVLNWLNDKYGRNADVESFIKEFQFRIENYSKIDVGAIGVVLPLSGDKEVFGKRALAGIDSALNYEKNKALAAKVFTRDSKDNPAVAQKMINDLIQKHHVSIIIGGLFPNTSKDEYLEAKKYGVLYISLSSVNLPKEEKTHLLLEVPGSIQSQIAKVMNEDFLSRFGKRIAVIYPDNETGHSYVSEVWRKSQQGLVEIASIYSYEKNSKDFRDSVSRVLGLHYKRERKEELELWNEIFEAQKQVKRSSIRRIQTLKPVVDFDWVFVPAFPQDAIQILPVFSYFDAKKIKFVGGPSWMTRSLIDEQKNLGQIFFVGDDPKDISQNFTNSFKERNRKGPGFIETMAFEALDISLNIIHGTKFTKREELESRLINIGEVKGITGSWKLKEGIWIKNMDFLRIHNKRINKYDISKLTPVELKKIEESAD